MKKIIFLLAALYSTASFSQASRFEGPHLQASTGYESNTISNTGFLDSNYPSNSITYFTGTDAKSTGMPLILSGSYYGAINSKYLLGIGLDYSALKSKSADFITYNFNSLAPVSSNYEVSSRTSYYLSPAIAIDSSSMAYAKFGFTQQNIKLGPPNVIGTSITQHGNIFGAGYKKMYSENLYGFIEANYMTYGSSAKDYFNTSTRDIVQLNPSATSHNLLVGIGYKF